MARLESAARAASIGRCIGRCMEPPGVRGRYREPGRGARPRPGYPGRMRRGKSRRATGPNRSGTSAVRRNAGMSSTIPWSRVVRSSTRPSATHCTKAGRRRPLGLPRRGCRGPAPGPSARAPPGRLPERAVDDVAVHADPAVLEPDLGEGVGDVLARGRPGRPARISDRMSTAWTRAGIPAARRRATTRVLLVLQEPRRATRVSDAPIRSKAPVQPNAISSRTKSWIATARSRVRAEARWSGPGLAR